jgi:hypothetical protein
VFSFIKKFKPSNLKKYDKKNDAGFFISGKKEAGYENDNYAIIDWNHSGFCSTCCFSGRNW